jgi:four helix bundle protein
VLWGGSAVTQSAVKHKWLGAKSEEQSGKSERQIMRPHFRFEDLEIWQLACEPAVKLHTLAGRLDERKFYRYAERLRGAGLSLTNNIAEGSGSVHQAEFRQFLNIARRSLFADASMLLVFHKLKLLIAAEVDELLEDCDILSRKITKFSRSLE